MQYTIEQLPTFVVSEQKLLPPRCLSSVASLKKKKKNWLDSTDKVTFFVCPFFNIVFVWQRAAFNIGGVYDVGIMLIFFSFRY